MPTLAPVLCAPGQIQPEQHQKRSLEAFPQAVRSVAKFLPSLRAFETVEESSLSATRAQAPDEVHING